MHRHLRYGRHRGKDLDDLDAIDPCDRAVGAHDARGSAWELAQADASLRTRMRSQTLDGVPRASCGFAHHLRVHAHDVWVEADQDVEHLG